MSWLREEALASVLAVEMVDLPVSENQAKYEDEFGAQQGEFQSPSNVERIYVMMLSIHRSVDSHVLKKINKLHTVQWVEFKPCR